MDPLSVLGGVASVGQILGAVIKTIDIINDFCCSYRDAPAEFKRIHDKLNIIKFTIFALQAQLADINDEILLPSEVRTQFLRCIDMVENSIESLQRYVVSEGGTGNPSAKSRLRWAFTQQRIVQRHLEHLRESEAVMSDVLQVINMRCNLIICASLRKLKDNGAARSNVGARTLVMTSITHAVLCADNWLRYLGIYGHFTQMCLCGTGWKLSAGIGWKFSIWLWAKSVLFQLDYTNTAPGNMGSTLLSCHISIQNRVSIDSSFMTACRHGDIDLMRQHLRDGTGRLQDRTICTGQTPLLLAINSNNVNAVRFLLESGADPDTGNDEQVLPVFAVAGMNPGPGKKFVQLPPTRESWIELLEVLFHYGASPHEVVHGKTMSMLNIQHGNPQYKDHTMRYFQALGAQHYMDFNLAGQEGWSATLSAIRSKLHGYEAVRFLAKANVDFGSILNDGRSHLHLAAEMAMDVRVLEFVFDNGCQQYLDRTDAWGWTPLHYSIVSQATMRTQGDSRLANLRFLLRKGADPTINGSINPTMVVFAREGIKEVSPIDLAVLYHQDLGLINAIKNEIWKAASTLNSLSQRLGEDIFYDAVEVL